MIYFTYDWNKWLIVFKKINKMLNTSQRKEKEEEKISQYHKKKVNE